MGGIHLLTMLVNRVVVVVFVLCSLSLSQAQQSNNEQDFNQTLTELTQTNDLTASNSYRCGVFFAGDELNDAPRFKIFIIPKRFQMECSKSKAENQALAKQECLDLFNLVLTKINMDSPSRKRKGFKIGDDLCKI